MATLWKKLLKDVNSKGYRAVFKIFGLFCHHHVVIKSSSHEPRVCFTSEHFSTVFVFTEPQSELLTHEYSYIV